MDVDSEEPVTVTEKRDAEPNESRSRSSGALAQPMLMPSQCSCPANAHADGPSEQSPHQLLRFRGLSNRSVSMLQSG
jgi:hypothetical protein